MYERWMKLKSGYVSDKNERIGLITWWLNIIVCAAVIIRGGSLKIFERDFPLFSSALLDFFTWLSEQDPIGSVLATPLAFICLGLLILTYISLFLVPRKIKAWKGIVLIISILYLVFEIPTLIAVRIMSLPILDLSFFWCQILLDLLMLSLFILKIKIYNNVKYADDSSNF